MRLVNIFGAYIDPALISHVTDGEEEGTSNIFIIDRPGFVTVEAMPEDVAADINLADE